MLRNRVRLEVPMMSEVNNEPSFPRKLEFFVHLCVWCSAVFYSIYRASKSALDLFHLLPVEDFEVGWNLFFEGSRRRDVSDYEWSYFSAFIPKYVPWILLHVFASNLLKTIGYRNLLLLFYSFFSLVVVVFEVGFAASGFLLFQVVLMFCTQLVGKKWFCWMVSISLLCLLNLQLTSKIKDYLVASDTQEEFALAVIINWTNCRCLSFCMIKCDERKDEFFRKKEREKGTDDNELLVLLAFCLYFPLLFSGPLVMYDDFLNDISRPSSPWSFRRIVDSVFDVLRYSFWFLFNDFVLHFFYVSALHYQPHLVSQLPLWSLCGLGFAMSQFFMTKYTVLYGLPSAIARLEGIETPPKPKCIARIHLYSDMWKYFDYGLYTFLKRFIYIPLVGIDGSFLSKLVGGSASFAFVYVWHGMSSNILIWTLFNFLGVTIENIFVLFARTQSYLDCKKKLAIGSNASRQLRAFITAPLLIMSAISNFYFICGGDVGDVFVGRFLFLSFGPCFLVCAMFRKRSDLGNGLGPVEPIEKNDKNLERKGIVFIGVKI